MKINMEKVKHTPKQERSRMMKVTILNTAMSLFCTKGYTHVTTNEIAKEAGISIGTLYFHFHDKEEILYLLLEQYDQSFLNSIESLGLITNNTSMEQAVFMKWLKKLFQTLINLHEESKEFNLELKSLYYLDAQVKQNMDRNSQHIYGIILTTLQSYNNYFQIQDFEASTMLIQDIISSTVDRIVFTQTKISKTRLINASIHAICSIIYN